MDIQKIIELAKKGKAITDQRILDPRSKRVLGFFVSKGLLINEKITPRPNIKLDMHDVIWVAKNLEPRIWEVLPAACIHFPKTFLHLEILPKPIRSVIETIIKQQPLSGSVFGISYQKMKQWAEISMRDKRVKPIGVRKVTKTFRLSPDCIKILKKCSKTFQCTETDFLE